MSDVNKKAIELLALGIDMLEGKPGEKGETGPQGEKGEQGPAGKDGKDGVDGVGKDGKDGKDGKIGPKGPKGDTGPAGPQGPAGKDGVDGKDGNTISPELIIDITTPIIIQNVHKAVGSKTITPNDIQGLAEFVSENGGTVTIKDTFGITVDGAGTVLTTGTKGYRYIEQDCTITGWDVRSDISGDIVFDVKRNGVSLAGTEKPTLTATTSASDLSLSTWTTSLVAGDIIEFVIDSASTITRATLTILITKI